MRAVSARVVDNSADQSMFTELPPMHTVVRAGLVVELLQTSANACRMNGNATATGKLRTNVATPRRPETSPGDSAARRSYRLSNAHAQGLIHIRAELGIPNAYPAPGSRVTTTSYA